MDINIVIVSCNLRVTLGKLVTLEKRSEQRVVLIKAENKQCFEAEFSTLPSNGLNSDTLTVVER